METKRICRGCGKPLEEGAPQGLCPACLMKVGLGIGTASGGGDDAAGAAGFEPPSAAELAARFPQFDVLEMIGRGGMGAVYKARQKNLDRIVALKILARRPGEDPAFAERFAREARALARLSHANIVGVHDFGETGGLYYLVMEFVDGVNMRQLLQGGQVSPREALGIVQEICTALQYAHDLGIVHRDIKPENILIDKQGRVKIADFGLAKLLGAASAPERLTRPRDIMGTPHYMAPEQVEHPTEVDHRADIYSLGVVFYELLTGELPLGKFPPPSARVQVDVRLDEVVLRTLEKQPERRYQQASEVKTAVAIISSQAQAAESPHPVGAKQPGIPPIAARNAHPTSGHPSRRLLARLALAMLLAGILGPPILMALSPRHEMALIFGATAFLLASVFGFISWRERMGRVVAIFTLIMLAGSIITGTVGAVIWMATARRAQAVQHELARANEAKARALAEHAARKAAQGAEEQLRQEAIAREREALALQALQVKHRQAMAELSRLEQLQKAGVISLAELQKARDEAELLAAQMRRDSVQVVRVRLAAAQRELNNASRLFQAGTISTDEFDRLKNAVELLTIELASAASSNTVTRGFGPVIARAINSAHSEKDDIIDFDTGIVLSTADFPDLRADLPRAEAIHQWVRQRGLDALGDRSTIQGLQGFDLIAVPVYADEWDSLSAGQLEDPLKAGKPGTPALIVATEKLPATYLFQTREGGKGILQILELTENPAGVRIRYKLVNSR